MSLFRQTPPPAPGPETAKRPSRGRTWTDLEVQRGRVGTITKLIGPAAQLFMKNFVIVGLLGLVIVQEIRVWKNDEKMRSQEPIVIRVNDVGKAEAVRVDQTWVPEEPDIRNQLHALTVRMFARNGFTLPEAIELNGAFLVGEAYKTWVKQAKEDLKAVAALQGLCRVRVLYLQIERVAEAKTPKGTRATIRYATDDLTENGAVIAGTAKGYEVTFDFRVGDWLKTDKPDERKNWTTRNPLGLRLMRYQVQQYQGADVADQNAAQVVNLPGRTADYAQGGYYPDVYTAQQDHVIAGMPLSTTMPVLDSQAAVSPAAPAAQPAAGRTK